MLSILHQQQHTVTSDRWVPKLTLLIFSMPSAAAMSIAQIVSRDPITPHSGVVQLNADNTYRTCSQYQNNNHSETWLPALALRAGLTLLPRHGIIERLKLQGRVFWSILLALEMTELLLVFKTSSYKLWWYRWTWMNVFNLLRNTPSILSWVMLLMQLGAQLFMVLQTPLSRSVILFIFYSWGKKKDFMRCKGVHSIFILWLNLSIADFYTTHHNVFTCTCRRNSWTCKCFQNKSSFCPQGDSYFSLKNGLCDTVWSEEQALCY